VYAGTHRSLETATPEIFRLRGGGLHPGVERRGDGYVVVLEHCASHTDATALQERAKRAGVRCSIVGE
jgi:hypothetical protein